jgi:ribosomal protein S18 acetylase RimI-like enzyme
MSDRPAVEPPDLPAGLTRRPATMDDAPAVTDLVAACERAEHGDSSISLEDLTAFWRRPSVHLATMTMLILDGDRIVGDAELFGTRAEVFVHPEARSRGIGSALRDWTERMAIAGPPRDRSFTLRQVVADVNRDAVELLRRAGYGHTRDSWILERRLDRPVEVPTPPDGVVLRTARVHDDDEVRGIFEVIEGSFREWGIAHDPETYEDWRADTVDRGDFDPGLLFVADARGAVAGACVAFDQAGLGWVHQLAVHRDRRRRGLGRALLLQAFGEFRRRGSPAVGLSTNSATGALDLYLRTGMAVTRTYRHYERALSPGDRGGNAP